MTVRKSGGGPLHRPSYTRQSQRSSISHVTSHSHTTLDTLATHLPPAHKLPVPFKPQSTFGSNFPHRSASVATLPSLAWRPHDRVVQENFWKATLGKLEHHYHNPSENLVVSPGEGALARPTPMASLRCQEAGLPDLMGAELVKQSISDRLDHTRKQYRQILTGAVSESQTRQAVLLKPVHRYRHHFGRQKYSTPSTLSSACGSSYHSDDGMGVRDRMTSKLLQLQRTLPSRSPTPQYPWVPPDMDDRVAKEEELPNQALASMGFAEKVLTMIPGRKM